MELKIIIWIVLGLIYLFARRKKNAVPPAPPRGTVTSTEKYEPEAQSSKPMTFEDLLREIEGSKKPEPVPQPTFHETAKPVPQTYYDEDVPEQRKPLEDTNYDYRKYDKIYEDYDNATKNAFIKPSLEETMKLEDTIVRFNQFKGYQQEPRHHVREELLRDLKDPKGFKKAFILSEILQRKF
ncbi:hypothetical protein BH10BAC4_BH10BAC4_10280 [soil metagenome]